VKELVIRPGHAEKHYWKDLWNYRELFLLLAWRDISVRYKQTVIGVAWSVIRPVLTMIVFTVVFGRIANLPSDGVPYPILVFTAMLPWMFFSTALSEASNSLVGNATLVSKVYFPRLIVPASSIIVCFVDFLISALILAILMVWYQFVPDWTIILLPFFLFVAFGLSFGAGLWFAALNVKYRDFRYIVPFIAQLGLYISPVGFSSNIVPEEWRLLYSMNPMVGVIDGFRWAVFGGDVAIYWPGFTISVVMVIGFLIFGIRYFRKTEKSFADVI